MNHFKGLLPEKHIPGIDIMRKLVLLERFILMISPKISKSWYFQLDPSVLGTNNSSIIAVELKIFDLYLENLLELDFGSMN